MCGCVNQKKMVEMTFCARARHRTCFRAPREHTRSVTRQLACVRASESGPSWGSCTLKSSRPRCPTFLDNLPLTLPPNLSQRSPLRGEGRMGEGRLEGTGGVGGFGGGIRGT